MSDVKPVTKRSTKITLAISFLLLLFVMYDRCGALHGVYLLETGDSLFDKLEFKRCKVYATSSRITDVTVTMDFPYQYDDHKVTVPLAVGTCVVSESEMSLSCSQATFRQR